MNIKSSLETLKAYQPKKVDADIKLDANEQNTSLKFILENKSLSQLNRYPEIQDEAFILKLCETFGYQKQQVLIGSGSSEVIDLIIKTYVNPDEIVLSVQPTFVMYEHYTKVSSARYHTVLESHQTLDDLYQAYVKLKPKVICISNPNNPTGTFITKQKLIAFISKVTCAVIVDEAYIEYTDTKESLLSEVEKLDNLFVTRSFSKAWGLAGARLGYVVSQESNIKQLMIAKTPYSIPTLSTYLGIEALKMKSKVYEQIEDIVQSRHMFEEALSSLGMTYTESHANFVYINFKAFDLYDALLQRKIIIRSYQNGFYRITIGTHKDMKHLIHILKEIIT